MPEENIQWRDSLEAAKSEAASSGKLVFLELFSPKCAGCQNVEQRTLPDPRVEALLNEAMVPFHYDVLAEEARMKEFVAGWTPTMIIMDGQGREHRRSTGFWTPIISWPKWRWPRFRRRWIWASSRTLWPMPTKPLRSAGATLCGTARRCIGRRSPNIRPRTIRTI